MMTSAQTIEKADLISSGQIPSQLSKDFSDFCFENRWFSIQPKFACHKLNGLLGSTLDCGLAYRELALMLFSLKDVYDKGANFYDFGAGTGTVCFMAASAGFNAFGHERVKKLHRFSEVSLPVLKLQLQAGEIDLRHGDCLKQEGSFYAGMDIFYAYPYSSELIQSALNLYRIYAKPTSVCIVTNAQKSLVVDSALESRKLSIDLLGFTLIGKDPALLDKVLGALRFNSRALHSPFFSHD